MTAVKTAYYNHPYKIFEQKLPKVRTKKKGKYKKENIELSLLGALLLFGNIIAIAKSSALSFGIFGYFLLGITGISLLGTLFGKIVRK